MSQIEQIIGDIENYLDGCKAQPFSGNKKIIIEKDTMDEMLSELRLSTPEEIKKYQKIVSNRDEILADAKNQADGIIAEANKTKAQMISQSDVMKQAEADAQALMQEAQETAQKTVDDAVAEADTIRQNAIEYTDQLLKNIQMVLAHTLESSQGRFNAFYEELQSSYDVVTSNRNELVPQAEQPQEAPSEESESAEETVE